MADKKLSSGRASTHNTENPFLRNRLVQEHPEGLDEPADGMERISHVHYDYPKKVVNRVDSPDVPLNWSLNPYQGCEHGCIYCYARNSHTYWGFSAGLDFEQQVIAKPDAPKLLRDFLSRRNYKPEAISLSGNTDCYQPIERKLKITRQLLEIFLEFRHPVGIITKNSLIQRDLDLLIPLAEMNLVKVMVSLTTLDEQLRLKMEPRTASAASRLKTIKVLSDSGIPTGIMAAPIIPGLNSHEIPAILQAASEAGATSASYTMVRLNGQVAELFEDWLDVHYPDRKNKVLGQIAQAHGGRMNDSRFGKRMRGEGPVADAIRQLFVQSRNRFFQKTVEPGFDDSHFRVPENIAQMKLF